MSALARYFLTQGKIVHGYDKTQTTLTHNLENEGMKIHYNDDVSNSLDFCLRELENCCRWLMTGTDDGGGVDGGCDGGDDSTSGISRRSE